MFRYLSFAWNASSAEQTATVAEIRARLRATADWALAFDNHGLLIACAGAGATGCGVYPLGTSGGVVLGSIFERHESLTDEERCASPNFEEATLRLIFATDGRALIDKHWGRYVAFINNPVSRCVQVIRDPSSQLPCFYVRYRDVYVFFSNLCDCIELTGIRFSVNWTYLETRLVLGMGCADATGLREVTQLYGGECIEIRTPHSSQTSNESERKSFYWDPVRVARANLIDDPHLAAAAVKATLRSSAASWATRYPRILHQLSGGIDSSLVLACFHSSALRPDVTAVTYYMPGGISDERPYARPAAAKAGYPHIEIARDPAAMDFRNLMRVMPSVNPDLSLTHLEVGAIEHRLCEERDITAVSTGMGGDTNLGSTSRPAMAKDFARVRGIRPHLFRLTWDVANASNRSYWTVLKAALLEGVFRFSSEDILRAHQLQFRKLLPDELVAAATRNPTCPHPWFRAETLPRPGIARLLLAFAFSWDFYNPLKHPGAAGPEPLHVMNSQPLMELALQIPSWVFNERGRNRGLVRRAFERELPREVLRREWKDRGVGFYEAAFHRNLPFVREYLLGGALIQRGLLDAGRVEAALRNLVAHSERGSEIGEICDYLTAECWLREWERPPVAAVA